MQADQQNIERKIKLYTTRGTIEGVLWIAPMQRTLDDLNLAARTFVKLSRVDVSAPEAMLGGGAISVNKNDILFLQELSSPPSKSGHKFAAGNLSRASVRLKVGSFDIDGFVHVPPGGSPITRLNQDSRSYISLTSVSVSGPDSHFATPFLAVNRAHIHAAQEEAEERAEADDPETRAAGTASRA